MKVCDVVLNSIWYDPRVRRQIAEYMRQDVQLSCVGIRCNRYDEEKVKQIPCPVKIATISEKYCGKQKSIFGKLKREYLQIAAIRDAIIEQKPDIIHANDLNALIPAYLAKRKLKCRLIFDSHEVWVENFFQKKQNAYAKMLEIVERFLVKRIDLMVCVSHAAASYFKEKYNITMPMVVTNCALQSDRAAAKDRAKTEGFEVINHGQFYEGRGYDIMAKACELIKDYPEIHLAIRGFGKLEESLRNTVSQCSNPEQFIFYPKVAVQELIPLAARSHVGVAITEPICLNFKLSVSNKLFEYAAAGLPVILSNIPEHRYLNEKYDFGLVLKEDTPQALADAVITLYQDKALYDRLARNAVRLSDEVNWENEFAKLIETEKGWMNNK